MKKISALDLMKKNFNVNYEATKLKGLFFTTPMFVRVSLFGEETGETFTFSQIFDTFILREWKFRKTYISANEILTQNNLDIDFTKKYTNEQLIDFLEIMYNIVYARPDIATTQFKDRPNITTTPFNFSIRIHKENYQLLMDVLESLIKNLELDEKKNEEGWVVLIPKNEALDRVIQDYDPVVQWQVISYLKIDKNDLEEKRKQLAYLATALNIEKDKEEKGYKPFDIIIDECTMILNNLNIRHNNKTGKWENNVLKDLGKKEALTLCDMLYDKMLIVTLIRKDLKLQYKIDEISQKLKEKKING